MGLPPEFYDRIGTLGYDRPRDTSGSAQQQGGILGGQASNAYNSLGISDNSSTCNSYAQALSDASNPKEPKILEGEYIETVKE